MPTIPVRSTVAWNWPGGFRNPAGCRTDLHFIDKPAFALRGTCIGMQKTYILPGRHVYEYPYTPELFPWFYDKKLWREYLDFLVANRMNTLYLWSGHPFASLVRLKDYPYAVEVPDDVFQKNRRVPLARAGMRPARHLARADVLQHPRLKAVCRDERDFNPAFRAHAAHGGLHAQIHRRIREAISERRPDGLSRRGVAGHAEPVELVHERDFARRA